MTAWWLNTVIPENIGGVPPLLIFGNATGVGWRVVDAIHESELFFRFRAYYHFRVCFCNPYSGWEKGNVERKVDYNRANLFVSVPHFTEIEKYNQKLLLRHEKKDSELPYKKQVPIGDGFVMRKKTIDTIPVLSDGIKAVLSAFSKSRSFPSSRVKKSSIILLASQGISNQVIVSQVGLHYKHVAIWRNCFLEALLSLREIEAGTP